MKKMKAAANPDAYVTALRGWQRDRVELLRTNARRAGKLEEVIKWGNLVYFHNGPVLVIRAEAARVLFGFWRGQRLTDLEPRLKPGGKYEMATLEIRKDTALEPSGLRRLVREAISLNRKLGNPAQAVKPVSEAARKHR